MRFWQDEFEQVAMPHAGSLLRLACRLTCDRPAGEDLVQETFLHAWRAYRKLPAGANARAWLFRILVNCFHDRGRSLGRLVGQTPGVIPTQVPRGVDIAESLAIEQALQHLPLEHRTVLLLGVVEGFTCREIADMLVIPIGTVMSRMNRARESMRKRLSPGPERKTEVKPQTETDVKTASKPEKVVR